MSQYEYLDETPDKTAGTFFNESGHSRLDNIRSIVELNASQQGLAKCDCCGYFTLLFKGQAERCGVCAWMDETESKQGLNRHPLAQARTYYLQYGACRVELASCTRQVRAMEMKPCSKA